MQSISRNTLAIAALGALVAGCQSLPVPVTAAGTAHGDTVQSAETFGNVEIRIAWPIRSQAIPFSANAIVVSAFDTLGREAQTAVLRRGADDASLQATSMRLKTGKYTIEVRAYRETTPNATSVPTAMGSAGNVVIRTDLKTPLSIVLTAQQATYGDVSAWSGAAGSQFTVDTVHFFGRPVVAGDTVELFFGYDSIDQRSRVPATVSIVPRRTLDPVTSLSQLSDAYQDKLLVTVPGGVTGAMKLMLRVDNVETPISGTFSVVDRMAFLPTSVTRAVGETYDANGDLREFSLQNAAFVAYPQLTWQSSQPNVAFVTQAGTVYAYQAGSTVLTARSGNLSASVTLNVTDRQSTASINVNVPTLNSGTASIPLDIPAYTGSETGTVTHQ